MPGRPPIRNSKASARAETRNARIRLWWRKTSRRQTRRCQQRAGRARPKRKVRAAGEIRVGEQGERGRTEIGEKRGGVNLFIEAKGYNSGYAEVALALGGEVRREAEINVEEEEGDGQGKKEELAGRGIEGLVDRNAEEAEDKHD